jgi:peroxiredoxin Q/BCP
VVVGPNGLIKWRADYGGAPDYTMYVPDSDLVAQMKAGGTGGTAL